MAKNHYDWLYAATASEGNGAEDIRFVHLIHEIDEELLATDGRELRWMPKPDVNVPDLKKVREFLGSPPKTTFSIKGRLLRQILKVAIEQCKIGSNGFRARFITRIHITDKVTIGEMDAGEPTPNMGKAEIWIDPKRLLNMVSDKDSLTFNVYGILDAAHIVYDDGRQALLMPMRPEKD